MSATLTKTDDTARARRAMIDSQLRPNGVTDKRLLAAFARVPREAFLPEAKRSVAYRDRGIELGGGEVAMAPTFLAKLIERADPMPGERALAIGPLADYAAALLSDMDVEVTTGEAAEGDRFDVIFLLGTVETVGEEMLARLAEGGRIAAALDDGGISRLAIGRRVGSGITFRNFADAQVAPLKGYQAPKGFQF